MLTSRRRRLDCRWGEVSVWRGPGGALHIRGDCPASRAFGLGWGHAHDRGVQMGLLRVVARGQTAAHLRASDDLLAQDRFLRRRRLIPGAKTDLEALSDECRTRLEAYCAGADAGRRRAWRPLVSFFLGLAGEPWTPLDVLSILRLLAYTSLSQTQEVVERLIIRTILHGTDHDRRVIRAAYAPHLDRLDDALIRGADATACPGASDPAPPLTLVDPSLEFDPICAACIPTFSASNAWALSGQRTASGAVLVANDPHLEAQNLPPAFYEVSMSGPDSSAVGVTVPGVPGVVAGRFGSVSVAVTAGFVDQVDFFVEECRDGLVRRGKRWEALVAHPEELRVRGRTGVEQMTVWTSDRGVIEGDPTVPGRYLARAWTADRWPLSPALDVSPALERASCTAEALDALSFMTLPFTYVVGDVHGSIGLQQAGQAPDRAPGSSGLAPEPGWDESRKWRGPLDRTQRARELDPECGFLVTANNDLNPAGGPTVVNSPVADHRLRRVTELVEAEDSATVESTCAIQADLLSLRAADWLKAFGAYLPDTPRGDILREWDCTYRPTKTAPVLWERLLSEWMFAIYGPLFCRADPSASPLDPDLTEGLRLSDDGSRLWLESNLAAVQGIGFDQLVLDPDSPVWEDRDREALLRSVAARALQRPAPPLNLAKRVRHSWFLIQGTWLARIGFASSMVPVRGAQSTPFQGRIVRTAGRVIVLGPIWRMISDLSERSVLTALLGGPSDGLFSCWYRSGVERFRRFRYKRLEPPRD